MSCPLEKQMVDLLTLHDISFTRPDRDVMVLQGPNVVKDFAQLCALLAS